MILLMFNVMVCFKLMIVIEWLDLVYFEYIEYLILMFELGVDIIVIEGMRVKIYVKVNLLIDCVLIELFVFDELVMKDG